MEPRYKSSKWTTALNIYLPFVVIAFVLSVIYFGGAEFEGNLLFIGPILAWGTIITFINASFIKYAEFFDDKIVIKESYGDIEVPYKNVEWVFQFRGGSDTRRIYLKYKDVSNGKDKYVITFPYLTFKEIFNNIIPFQDFEVTNFIRAKVMEVRPTYDRKKEPKGYLLMFVTFISFIPFFLLSMYLVGFDK